MEAHLERIKLPSNIQFIHHLAVTSHQPIEAATLDSPQDVHHDTKRELAIYKQALHAATTAKLILTKENIPFTRPDDYFAEMVKSDAHMARVRQRLLDERLQLEQAEKAKKLRNLKKFGKKVQEAKLLERQKAKKAALEVIKLARKKTGSSSMSNNKTKANNDDDEFDIQLESATTSSNSKSSKKITSRPLHDRAPSKRRQYKNSKYGFGGPKRHAKSNTAASTFDLQKSGFSVGKMKKRAFEASGKGYRPDLGFSGDGRIKKRVTKHRPGKSKRIIMKGKV